MFSWIIPIAVAGILILVLTEAWARRTLKNRDYHIYDRLAKTFSRTADDANEAKKISAVKDNIEKTEKMNRDI